MIICKFEEAESFETSEGIMRPIFASEKIAITHLEIPAGLRVKPHSHPGDGILILTEGSVKLVSKEVASIKPGDMTYVPANTEIGLESEEDSKAVILSVPSRYNNVEEFRDVLRAHLGRGVEKSIQ